MIKASAAYARPSSCRSGSYVAIVAAVLVACASRASAQTTTEYPLAIADRPILLNAGMTELDISADFPTFLKTDAMGNPTTTRSGFADNGRPGFAVTHSFGPVQVTAGVGPLFYGAVSWKTRAVPAVLSISLTSNLSARTDPPSDFYDAQSFAVSHKVVVSPGRFAVYGRASAALIEYSTRLDRGMASAGHIVWLSAHASGELQITPRLGMYFGASVRGPASESSNFHDTSTLASDIELRMALGTWDLYGSFELSNLTSTLLTYTSFGFSKRWGR
ncbi:MAG: hypothetical protein JWO36_3824 [Myxococcales bacterium]|nr:hypothetical protein [Myxococcales bacterium]